MKRNLFALLLCLVLAVSLAACGGPAGSNTDAPSSGSTQQPDDGPSAPGSYTFKTGGTEVAVGQDMADALSALGDPNEYFEAESCAFEGLDKTYTYSGFVITTYPDGDKDFINSIRLTDDSASTQEGAYIGCTADQVKDLYGESQGDLPTSLSYTKGGTTLNFILENDAVISIEYLPAE